MSPPKCSFNSCSPRWVRVIRSRRHCEPRCYSISSCHRLSQLANIEAKLLGNVVLSRRDSFLACSKVAGDQKLKKLPVYYFYDPHLIVWGSSHSCGKRTGWTKDATLVFQDRRATVSSTPAGQWNHSSLSHKHGLTQLSLMTCTILCQFPLLEWCQQSVGALKHQVPLQRSLEQDQKTYDWTGWWPPPGPAHLFEVDLPLP